VRIPASKCFKCGYKMAATKHAGNDHARPREGDISMCLHCGALMIFEPDLTMRPPTSAETDELKLHPEVIQAAILRAGLRKP
jgi:ribosomal protein L40E